MPREYISELIEQLQQTLEMIDQLIDALQVQALDRGTSVYLLMDIDGNKLLTPILMAKAECLSALVRAVTF